MSTSAMAEVPAIETRVLPPLREKSISGRTLIIGFTGRWR
jgi:hypothetical protein